MISKCSLDGQTDIHYHTSFEPERLRLLDLQVLNPFFVFKTFYWQTNDVFIIGNIYGKDSKGLKCSWLAVMVRKDLKKYKMKILSKLLIISNLNFLCLSHDIENSEAMINRFKNFFEPENLYNKRNFSPLADWFDFDQAISKRSNRYALGANRSFLQQLSNAFIAPFKQHPWTVLINIRLSFWVKSIGFLEDFTILAIVRNTRIREP